MTDAERYAITVRKVLLDGEELWRATIRELPDVAEFAETSQAALELALDSIESLKEDAIAEGREFPAPKEDDEEYSGRVTLRLPRSVHRAVALQAADEGISVNSYVIASLSYSIAQKVYSTTKGLLTAYQLGRHVDLGAAVGGGSSSLIGITNFKQHTYAEIGAVSRGIGQQFLTQVLSATNSYVVGTGTSAIYMATMRGNSPAISSESSMVIQVDDEGHFVWQ